MEPVGKPHELVSTQMLEGGSMDIKTRREMLPLFEYFGQEYAKPRGTEGGNKDLNSHKETLIIKEGNEIKLKDLNEFQGMLKQAGFNADLLGVHSIGNTNQTITSQVQGINENERKTTGFERPTVSEGPHMIMVPFAYDKEGNIHVFRTVQYRTNSAGIDTPRGFMDAETLKSGKHVYKVKGSEAKIDENIKKIIKEEGGEKFLKIKKVNFLGSHIVNKSFVTSPSALFGVEVDYEEFIKLRDVVSPEEAARRHEQKEHEGLTDIIIDMTAEQYVNYKTNPDIPKDMAADEPSDIVIMKHLFENQKPAEAKKDEHHEEKHEAKPEEKHEEAHGEKTHDPHNKPPHEVHAAPTHDTPHKAAKRKKFLGIF